MSHEPRAEVSWDVLEDLYARARDLPPDQRNQFLDRATANDAALRSELESLLDCSADAERFVDELADAIATIPADALAEQQLNSGARIGRYTVLEELGRGGMGVVYRVRDERLDRVVALKVLPAYLARDERAKRRFTTEAKAASATDHPNIATIHEIGETSDGRLYIVMACYDGETLKHRLQRGPMPAAEAIGIGRQIADGLRAAHGHGVVHRDIKPGNVFVTEDGWVKILDFGVAKIVDSDLTAPGGRVGTARYMAPEQVRGADVDVRADVWSLGLVLREMLTGSASSQPAADDSSASDPGAPASVPPTLAPIIDRCLEIDPDDRYESVDALLRDLDTARAAGMGATERSPYTDRKGGLGAGAPSPRRGSRPPARRGSWLHPGHERARWVRRAVGLVALAAVVSAGIWMYASRSSPAASGASAARIAVLPFTVRGSPEFAYLEEGMVDLLSTNLDGAGVLRTVDPNALLSFWSTRGDAADPRSAARATAGHFQAAYYLVGDIVEADRRLKISAALYGTSGDGQPVARAAVEGDAAQIFRLVDRLTAAILAERFGGRSDRLTRIAAVTTPSLPALKAYLQGESHARAGHYNAAIDDFRRAIGEDSTFALAHYRLSVAASWAFRGGLSDRAAEHAVRFADRLPERDRRILEARLAYRHGDAERAETLYRRILGDSPDHVEASYGLGEVLFHYNPMRGRSIAEARKWFRGALRFSPDRIGLLYHLAQIAAIRGDTAEVREMSGRALELAPRGERAPALYALRATALNRPAERRQALDMLREGADFSIASAAHNAAVYGQDVRGARTFARLLTSADRPRGARALGHVFIAELELALGRIRAADRELTAAARLDARLADEYRGLLALAPFASAGVLMPDAWDYESAPDADGGTDTAMDEASPAWYEVHSGAHRHLRHYASGLAHARAGRSAEAGASAGALEQLPPAPPLDGLRADLARGIRATNAARSGRIEEALEGIEEGTLVVPAEHAVLSPYFSQPHERYQRAELLRELGRGDEAGEWYRSLQEFSLHDLVYLAPAYIGLADLHEDAGDDGVAAAYYSRFIELWRDADPELQPIVRSAARRLEALQER